MNVHKLKTWPMFFEAVVRGTKPFEIRKNDRGFEVGDTLILQEWDSTTGEYTGREHRRLVSFVLADWGLEPGYVVLGLGRP
jgi:hypothetical protein